MTIFTSKTPILYEIYTFPYQKYPFSHQKRPFSYEQVGGSLVFIMIGKDLPLRIPIYLSKIAGKGKKRQKVAKIASNVSFLWLIFVGFLLVLTYFCPFFTHFVHCCPFLYYFMPFCAILSYFDPLYTFLTHFYPF
jgi:ABC-type multidrug transport system fused ATPase/permease subunit